MPKETAIGFAVAAMIAVFGLGLFVTASVRDLNQPPAMSTAANAIQNAAAPRLITGNAEFMLRSRWLNHRSAGPSLTNAVRDLPE